MTKYVGSSHRLYLRVHLIFEVAPLFSGLLLRSTFVGFVVGNLFLILQVEMNEECVAASLSQGALMFKLDGFYLEAFV